MKRLFIAAALALSVPMLGACNITEQIESASIVTEKAAYGAEALYNVPAHAYVTADGRGQIPATLKASLKPKLQSLYGLLLKAREAKAIGDKALFDSIVDQMKPLSAELSDLIPAK